MKGYMSAREASYKWGVSESRVHNSVRLGASPVWSASADRGSSPKMLKNRMIREESETAEMTETD